MRFGFEIISDLTESVKNHAWFPNTKYLFHAICTVTVYIQGLWTNSSKKTFRMVNCNKYPTLKFLLIICSWNKKKKQTLDDFTA